VTTVAGASSAALLLIVEDRDSLRRMLERALTGDGHRVVAVGDVAAARHALQTASFDLVLTDLRLPDGSGLDVLAASRERLPAPPLVVLTGYGSVETAVGAMKQGAVDFLEKPVELPTLLALVALHLRGRRSSVASAIVENASPAEPESLPSHEGAGGAPPAADASWAVPGGPLLVGSAPSFRAACRLLQRVAPMATTVLLSGESGTGKELFARAVHALSPRRSGPFVALNCAAIPDALLENELFGHEKGSFTGADRRQPGRFEQAHGGTLFLDEVGELAPGVQGKVLRVLEEHAFERVGGSATVRVDVRLVAATNRNLEEMVAAGRFRSDLFFRLNVFPIVLPPLRERPGDLPALARHLVTMLAARHGVAVPEIDTGVLSLLAAHGWPGNVRELANVLERAVIIHDGRRLVAADVSPYLSPPPTVVADDEPARLRAALAATAGDKLQAAASLGLSYRTLQRRIKEYDLEGFPKYRS
jgi:DNA-binding NtrC family response regulator